MQKLTLGCVFGLTLMGLSLATPASAQFIDPTGDFTGAANPGVRTPDLDVVSANVIYDPFFSRFTFTATMAGNIGSSNPTGFYVWGVNRGQGAAGFAAAPLSLTNVLFDSVVILRADGTGQVNRTIPAPTSSTIFTPGTVQINGATISATIAASELPSNGFTPENYTWNLWPRIAGGGQANISDFAPDTTNFRVTVAPEPTSLLLLVGGLLPIVVRRRK